MITALFGAYFIGGAAAFFLGNHPVARRARLGLVIVLLGSAIVVYNDPNHVTADFVTIPATFAVAWLAGMAIRNRVEKADEAERRAAVLARERESATRLAVAEERSRIARELHDVVAHSMSVMVLQVGAVRHRLPVSLADDRNALEAVERTGRGALTEMRRLLGVIDEDIDVDLAPQPGLDRLEALIEEVSRAGLPVDLHIDGDAETLPRGIDLSAYRIIQEGLTNSLKHANATRADVTVSFGGDDLRIEVEDDGRGQGSGDGAGRGLTGIRERVKIYGGEMSAGPPSGGGYRLEVRLPLRSPR
jgi:signal transduction histidine kinase